MRRIHAVNDTMAVNTPSPLITPDDARCCSPSAVISFISTVSSKSKSDASTTCNPQSD